jgi:hypothetical protein
MSESILRPPASRQVGALADWIEATMAIEGRSMLAKALIRRRLAADGNDDEASISLVMTEVRRRRRIAGDLYPFDAVGAGVRRSAVAHRAYEFLLLCSLDDAPFRQDQNWSNAVRLFEQLAAAALGSLFGPGTRGLRFGYPPEPGRPERFADALKWLADDLGLAVGAGKASSNEQDGGVDAVAWRPFRDGRPGFPVALAQCTLQQAFEAKGSDIVLQRWKSWIAFHRDPLTALIVPFVLGQDAETWDDLHFTVDLVVDRLRMCELLERVSLEDWPEATLLGGWLDHELGGLRLAS